MIVRSFDRDRDASGPAAARNGAGLPWSLPAGSLHRLVSRTDPGREYLLYVPTSGGLGAPVFVTVHGISGNVVEHASLFSTYAEKAGAVLVAPYFAPGQSQDYQRLGREGRGPRADHALHAILGEASRLTGADVSRIHLFGFSGGAQFAHRYTMAHPQRVAGVVVAAAGWYSFPDLHLRYPYGIRRCRALPDLRFDPDEFLRVPMTVIVGDRDVTNVDLRSNPRLNRQQGETRLERARNWVEAMRATARVYRVDPLVTLETVPGGDHSFAGLMEGGRLGDLTFAALFGARAGVSESRDA